MFVPESEAGNKVCPVLTKVVERQPCPPSPGYPQMSAPWWDEQIVLCKGSRCMFWREGPAMNAERTGYCGYAPIAPHRDLTKRL